MEWLSMQNNCPAQSDEDFSDFLIVASCDSDVVIPLADSYSVYGANCLHSVALRKSRFLRRIACP